MTYDSQQSPEETSLLRVELSENVRQLVDTIEQAGFDMDESTYTFIDPDFVDHTWLPLDIAALVTAHDTAMKKIDISYSTEAGSSRPGSAIVIYLTNGERITLIKHSSDPTEVDFEFNYTDSSDSLQPLKSSEVARLITSILFPDMHRSDTTMSQLLVTDEAASHLDPTDPLLSRYILQLLPQRADSWKREESIEMSMGDDNNLLRVVRTTSSKDGGLANISFTQTGTELDEDAFFETVIRQRLDTHEASVSYEQASSDHRQQGDVEEKPYIYDFTQTIIKLANKALSDSAQPTLSYEEETERILRTEAFNKDT